MEKDSPYLPPQSRLHAESGAQQVGASVAQNTPRIGGWLILVAFGVVLSPIRMAAQFFQLYFALFSNGSWAALTTPGSEAYNALWMPLLLLEMGVNAGLFIFSLVIVFLFFSRKRLFPRFYIIGLMFSLAFQLLDAWAFSAVLTDEPMFDPDTVNGLLQLLVGAAIWVPYMLVSKRVRATFVR